MPQTRRKTPFSGKKKKDQLFQKRQLKGKYNLQTMSTGVWVIVLYTYTFAKEDNIA